MLVKAIEDVALGMASVYRRARSAAGRALARSPDERRAPHSSDLVARIMPFDLVIDEQTADGQEARVSRGSVAGSWGAVAGTLRYFADRFGNPRAGIEGTQIPERLIKRYARRGPPVVEFSERKGRGHLIAVRTVEYFGFLLERDVEPLPDPFPVSLAESARAALVAAVLQGRTPHPDQRSVRRALERSGEYWRRSGGTLAAAATERLSESLVEQLANVSRWDEFIAQRLTIDPDVSIPAEVRAALDALPSSVHLYGDRVPLDYDIEPGGAVVRLRLKEGQARRVRSEDLPSFDRPLRFTVIRGKRPAIQATSLEDMRRQLTQLPRTERARLVRGGRRPRRR